MTTADEYSPMGILNIENAVMYWSNQSDGRVISFKGNENNNFRHYQEVCFNHARDIILYSFTDWNVMELIQAIKYVAVVFTICLHDMSEKKVMSFSTVIKQITEVHRDRIKALHV